jgi:hypothetical protein
MIEPSQTSLNSGAGGRDRTPNLRFTNLLPSVRQRSSPIECTIFSGQRVEFRSSLFVSGCRRWGQMWGQGPEEQPSTLISFGTHRGVQVSSMDAHRAGGTSQQVP